MDNLDSTINTPAPTYSGVGYSLSELGMAVEEALAIVTNSNARYKFNAGRAEQSLFNTPSPKTDDFHLASWFLYTTGLSDLSVDEVNDAENTIIYSEMLDTVIPGTTADDGSLRKYEILDRALPGDILLFDTFHKNSSVGIYLEDGTYCTVTENSTESGLVIHNLWSLNDFGEREPGADLLYFNGTLKRLPKLNEGGYEWYYRTNGTISLT